VVSFQSIIILLCTVCYYAGPCHEGWLSLASFCCIETFYITEHPDSVPCHEVNCVRICQTFTIEKKEFLHLVRNRTAAFLLKYINRSFLWGQPNFYLRIPSPLGNIKVPIESKCRKVSIIEVLGGLSLENSLRVFLSHPDPLLFIRIRILGSTSGKKTLISAVLGLNM
jgi:hypothetical protein